MCLTIRTVPRYQELTLDKRTLVIQTMVLAIIIKQSQMLIRIRKCQLERGEILLLIRTLKRVLDLDQRARYRIQTRAVATARSARMQTLLSQRLSDLDSLRTRLMSMIEDDADDAGSK